MQPRKTALENFTERIKREVQRQTMEDAIHQLHALESELREVHTREAKRITEREALALKMALAEIHRLHHAVNDQRRQLEKRGPKHPRTRPRPHKSSRDTRPHSTGKDTA